MENSPRVIRVIVDPTAENNSVRNGPNKDPGFIWNPTKQLQTASGKDQSAAAGMGHEEIGHVLRDFLNSVEYDTDLTAASGTPNVSVNEEKATNVSNAIARDLGEIEQQNYMDIDFGNPEPATTDVTAHSYVPLPVTVTPEQPLDTPPDKRW